jgi:Rer1 family
VQTYQLMLDKWTPYAASRWITTVLLILAFIARIIYAKVCTGTSFAGRCTKKVEILTCIMTRLMLLLLTNTTFAYIVSTT